MISLQKQTFIKCNNWLRINIKITGFMNKMIKFDGNNRRNMTSKVIFTMFIWCAICEHVPDAFIYRICQSKCFMLCKILNSVLLEHRFSIIFHRFMSVEHAVHVIKRYLETPNNCRYSRNSLEAWEVTH